MVEESGALRRMTPSAPESEDKMQALVARYPELISDGDGDLLLIRREQSIADSEDGGGRWSVDHLFVTREAVPVLVELKRAVDTRLRREVVGQMLDYAANATAFWQAGRIAESFAKTADEAGQVAEDVLAEFLDGREAVEFWDQVDANFTAGRIKLVFVADTIPRELARIVEFLNDQMRADVRAVELRWFSGDGGVITMSPRVIGETERAAASKRSSAPEPLTRDAWLAKNIAPAGDAAKAGALAYIDMVERLGGDARVAVPAQGSIYAQFKAQDGKLFYPLSLWVDGQMVSLSLRWLQTRPALQNESARRALYDSLVDVVGPLSTPNLTGFPSFKVAVLADPNVAVALQGWLADMVARLR